MKKLFIIALCIIGLNERSVAQIITQTVKGKVTDQATREELFGVTIILIGSDPLNGTSTDVDGTFILENVPVGRRDFEFRRVGHKTYVASEVLVSSGKEVILDIRMNEEVITLEGVTIEFKADKDKPINELATISSRQFTVEETKRYAGGMDDPARMVSSFAGVAAPTVSSNAISVRGNHPSGLLWRVEGVEIPSPNHFADLTIAGAGALTVLSSQMLSNSDFHSGAFPAEYGNATSGVFDINLRNGNSSQREHTFEAGILGIDLSSEGPLNKENGSSYLFNYRYSTLALIGAFLPSDAGILKYQDLSFKIKMPTENAGTFSLWSLAALDGIDIEATDSLEWESEGDRENSQTSQYMYATGLNHKINLGSRTVLNSSLAFTGHGTSFKEQYLDNNLLEHPQSKIEKNSYTVNLQSKLTTYFNDRHFNRSGVTINQLGYDLFLANAEDIQSMPEKSIDENGNSLQFQFYSQSQFILARKWTLNAGLHSQYFELNKNFTIEPRVSVNYQLDEKSNLGFAYGLHTKPEALSTYFVKDEFGNTPNKNLDLMKSHHFVLSYNNRLKENLKLTIEPYFQYLTAVPVVPDSYISTLNVQNNLFFDEQLVSNGTARNLGIDVSLERNYNRGYYWMLTGSVFDSKYTAEDGIDRNTRFNKNYTFNAVFGKEWQVGKKDNNTLSANIRLNYLGGNRADAIDNEASAVKEEVVYDETNGELTFSERFSDTPIWSFNVSYRKNKPNYSSVWSLQVLNSSSTEEWQSDIWNLETQSVERQYSMVVIPSISYRIEF